VGIPCQAASRWQNEVVRTHDAVNGGTPLLGLAGRLYLYSAENPIPLLAEGKLIVNLYDDRPLHAGGQPKPLEQWQFDRESLKQLVRKDFVGWGYTLFLPWVHTYSPDIDQVHLHLTFVPDHGGPVYTGSQTFTLVHGERQFLYSSSQVLGKSSPRPGAPGQAVAAGGQSAPPGVASAVPSQPPASGNQGAAVRQSVAPGRAPTPAPQGRAQQTATPAPAHLAGQPVPTPPAPSARPSQQPRAIPMGLEFPAPKPRGAPAQSVAPPASQPPEPAQLGFPLTPGREETAQPAAESPADVRTLGQFPLRPAQPSGNSPGQAR
jgi:hypothetical protein